MLLAIDIGNSVIDFGVYSGNSLVQRFKMDSDLNKTVPEYRHSLRKFLEEYQLNDESFEGAIISSVVPFLGETLQKVVFEQFDFTPTMLQNSHQAGLAIAEDVDSHDLGADIIADCAGAMKKYGTCLAIADIGTATKVIFVNQDGEFAGISIAPGLKMGGRALKEKTAALPELPLATPERAIGKNTNEALVSGVSYGMACLVKGLAEVFESEAGYPLRWVLTGGDSKYIKDLLPEFSYDESLTLDGLSLIYQRTHQ